MSTAAVTRDPWPASNPEQRVARSRSLLRACARDADRWFALREGQTEFAVFAAHFNLLQGVLHRMIDAVAGRLDALEGDAVAVHTACRDADARTDLIRRLFHWYRDKYDQRTDDVLGPVIRAADAVIRSCWTMPFTVAEVPQPSGPLTWLEHRHDAAARLRASVPGELRAADDPMIGEFVAKLPIPVVVLPAVSVVEPWWLVLAAHETGHHVLHDLDAGLAEAAAEAIRTALNAAPEPLPETVAYWPNWAEECFADAFAVLCVGPAAIRAVADLEYGPPRRLVRFPDEADRYPPPAVRLALHGELARAAGLDRPGPGADDVTAWLDELPAGAVAPLAVREAKAHLRLVPAVAAALLGLRVNDCDLAELCGFQPARFAAGGEVAEWLTQLPRAEPVIVSRGSQTAASSGIAAAAALPADRGTARKLLALLARSGPPGTLAGPLRAGGRDPDVATLAAELADRLFTVDLPDLGHDHEGDPYAR